MCSITFLPRRSGYVLGMNRDEKRTRVAALAPSQEDVSGRRVVYPREPGGGTWISLNDSGVTFALVNWYSQPSAAILPIKSRGEVVQRLRGVETPEEARNAVREMDLVHVNPFRVIGVFPALSAILEWQWDGRAMTEVRHGWNPRQWISSGWDEPGAQRSRSEVFEHRCREVDDHGVQWLRKLHGSHENGPGPYSTCMHREDAATVSYSEIEVDGEHGEMRYSSGPLCEAHGWHLESLSIQTMNAKLFSLFNQPIP